MSHDLSPRGVKALWKFVLAQDKIVRLLDAAVEGGACRVEGWSRYGAYLGVLHRRKPDVAAFLRRHCHESAADARQIVEGVVAVCDWAWGEVEAAHHFQAARHKASLRVRRAVDPLRQALADQKQGIEEAEAAARPAAGNRGAAEGAPQRPDNGPAVDAEADRATTTGSPHVRGPQLALDTISGSKIRELLSNLGGKGNVPIDDLLTSMYRKPGLRDPAEALRKVVTRANDWLSAHNVRQQVKREGTTYRLAPVD